MLKDCLVDESSSGRLFHSLGTAEETSFHPSAASQAASTLQTGKKYLREELSHYIFPRAVTEIWEAAEVTDCLDRWLYKEKTGYF